MTMQRVLTQTMNLFDDGKASQAKTKVNADAGVSFGTVMNRSVNQSKAEPSKDEAQLSLKKDKDSMPADYQAETEEKDRNAIVVSEQPQTANVSAKKEETKTAPEQETETFTAEELEAAMSQMQTAVIKEVTEVLGISEEELNACLEELNLKPLDLLNPSNAMQLVMKINALDEPMQVLTDEKLTVQLKELTANLEQVEPAADLGISREELMTALEKLPQKTDFAGVLKGATEDLQTVNQPKAEPEILVERQVKNPDTEKPAVTTEHQQVATAKEVSRETGTGGGQSESREGRSRNQQTPVQIFAENLAVKGQPQIMDAGVLAERTERMQNIVEQVVEQIKVQIKPQTTAMEIQLNPENLGKINLSVVSKDGQLTATITAQTQIAKEALEGQLQILKENLNNQGLKVEAVEVNVSSFAFDRNSGGQMADSQEQKKSQGGRRKIDLSTFGDQMDDASEEEILAADIMKQNGGSVDYSA